MFEKGPRIDSFLRDGRDRGTEKHDLGDTDGRKSGIPTGRGEEERWHPSVRALKGKEHRKSATRSRA